jgi:hypothetical protein
MPDIPQTEIHGKRVSLTPEGNLVGGNNTARRLTPLAVDATITVGAEDTNVRAITVQLLDANGAAITERTILDAYVFSDADATTIVGTGGSTGIAIGASGKLLATLIAKKAFVFSTTAAGLLTLTWTDTGTEAAYIGFVLPNGKLAVSAALTNT